MGEGGEEEEEERGEEGMKGHGGVWFGKDGDEWG